MKKLWLCFIGVVFGLFCYIEGNDMITTLKLSEIAQYPAFLSADCRPEFLINITHWFMPLLVFQMIYGVYIYRHFCSASIYFFSRNINRKKWFLKESVKLYFCSLLYLLCMIATGILVKSFVYELVWDMEGIIIIIYYLAIHSFYLFAATLAINILSIKFNSSIGFVSVMSVNIFGISLYSILGNLISEELLYTQYAWLFKVNPFAHLVFRVHSSKVESVDRIINKVNIDFDLNYSFLLFFVIAIALVVIGCIMCEKHEFIVLNKEEQ